MVEPVEETRTEIVFATEPVLSSLEHAIPGSGRHASLVELDEIEVRGHSVITVAACSSTPLRFRRVSCNFAKDSHSYMPPLSSFTPTSARKASSSTQP